MSTILNTNGTELQIPEVLDIEHFKCAVITAEWNWQVTGALRQGALDVLHKAGVSDDNILDFKVPGTVELVNAAALVRRHSAVDAIIVLGCVIRGDTPHFDYVCKIAAEGVERINSEGGTPVIFGVLTVENLQQALDRAGGTLGNKGAEGAVAAIQMSNFQVDFWKDVMDTDFELPF